MYQLTLFLRVMVTPWEVVKASIVRVRSLYYYCGRVPARYVVRLRLSAPSQAALFGHDLISIVVFFMDLATC